MYQRPKPLDISLPGIANLSQPELFRRVLHTSKPLKVCDLPQAKNSLKLVKPGKLTVPVKG